MSNLGCVKTWGMPQPYPIMVILGKAMVVLAWLHEQQLQHFHGWDEGETRNPLVLPSGNLT